MNVISTPTPPAVGQPITGMSLAGKPVTTGPVLRLSPWVPWGTLGVASTLATTADKRYVVTYPTEEVSMSPFPIQAPLKAETAVAPAGSKMPSGGSSSYTHYSMGAQNCNNEPGEFPGENA